MPRPCALALCLAALCGCPTSDSDIHALTPSLVVAPDAVDFGEVVVDYPAAAQVELINAGKATLTGTIAWVEGSATQLTKDLEVLEIPRDDRTVLNLTCLPTTYDVYSGTVLISSNDPDRPTLEIPVACTGVHAPTPDIELDPPALDFGEVAVGSSVTRYVQVLNVGDGDLHIVQTAQTDSGAFTVETDPTGVTISPDGDVFVALITYAPTTAVGDYGQLHIMSDDPDEPTVSLLLLGNCESAEDCDYEYPVAVIEGPTESEPLDTFTLDGSASYDPYGGALTYAWNLIAAPPGSSGHISGEIEPTTDLYVDLAGTYQVQLVVRNEADVPSAPTRHVVSVTPTDKIHVEMFWSAGDSDLDLHLAQEGTPLFQEPTDCNYCNPNPDWGVAGEGSDDPSLDLDDVTGFGPENINIQNPADGGYDMYVHYFRDSGAGAVTATVRVYLDGGVAFERSQILAYDERWFVGTVRWPEGVVAENEGDPLDTSTARSCYEE